MDEIEKWMVFNKLQLNGEKTDFVITGSTSLLKKLNISTMQVGDSTKPIFLYTHMTFKHISPYFKTFNKLLVCKAH